MCRRPDGNALVHSRQQEDQRRGDRLVREEDAIHTNLPHLQQIERERRQLIARQEDERRRQERAVRDQAGLEAIARHEAAARVRKAQEAEDRRISREQEKELRRIEKLADNRLNISPVTKRRRIS